MYLLNVFANQGMVLPFYFEIVLSTNQQKIVMTLVFPLPKSNKNTISNINIFIYF